MMIEYYVNYIVTFICNKLQRMKRISDQIGLACKTIKVTTKLCS